MAIDFLGTDELLSCGSGATIDGIFSAGGSVAFWVNIDVEGAQIFVCKGQDNAWELYQGDVDQVSFYRYWSGDNGAWHFHPTITTGIWYHVAVTYNDAATANDPIMYWNGVAQAVTEAGTPTGAADSDAAGTLVIGAKPNAANPLNGKMEDVRAYKRILTANEVAILAAGYRGPLGGEVLWLPMDTARGVYDWDGRSLAAANILHDQSGNKNHGTPSGTPLGEVI